MINTLTENISTDFSLNIKIAGEIEFYITPKFETEAQENDFLARLLFNLTAAQIPVWQLGKETTPGQYEVALQPCAPEIAVWQLNELKAIINRVLSTEYRVLFTAKPFDNLPGSGLHIHIGVNDKDGNSVLSRTGRQGEREGETEIMLNIIGGLCSTMLKNFTAFAPNQDSYKRFSLPPKPYPLTPSFAPTNISWGGNNRTTAIRIPASSYDETQRHIEHRVAGADANPEAVINAILEGIYVGLKEKPTPPEKIYGNAFDAQYNHLQPFPRSLLEAKSNLSA